MTTLLLALAVMAQGDAPAEAEKPEPPVVPVWAVEFNHRIDYPHSCEARVIVWKREWSRNDGRWLYRVVDRMFLEWHEANPVRVDGAWEWTYESATYRPETVFWSSTTFDPADLSDFKGW